MDLVASQDEFLSVIETHKGIIYKIVNSYGHTAEDRKDLFQEIIIQLWKSFGKYNDEFRYSTWIYRIALNVAISYYRKERTRKKISRPIPEDIYLLTEHQETGEKEKQSQMLQRFIGELNELDKALMILYLEEKSYREISGIMGISESNVGTRISRIRAGLKQKFSQTNL